MPIDEIDATNTNADAKQSTKIFIPLLDPLIFASFYFTI
jgi:hypothetical protein